METEVVQAVRARCGNLEERILIARPMDEPLRRVPLIADETRAFSLLFPSQRVCDEMRPRLLCRRMIDAINPSRRSIVIHQTHHSDQSRVIESIKTRCESRDPWFTYFDNIVASSPLATTFILLEHPPLQIFRHLEIFTLVSHSIYSLNISRDFVQDTQSHEPTRQATLANLGQLTL